MRYFPDIKFLASVIAIALLAVAGQTSEASAQAHIVVDRDTGEVLSHRNATRRWAPASLTKVMTAYVAFHAVRNQQLAMNSPVGVSENARSQPPTKMGFPVGTILTLENAIKLIMVKSANDISTAIAESVAGDEETFIRLMNSHARRIGMVDTRFENPHGLPDPLQYTTAVDMARMAIAVRAEFPEFAYLFEVPAVRVGRRRLTNYNRLLTRFEGTDGMKTGFVCASGYNIIVTATRKNRNLVAVVMGERSGYRRSIKAASLLAEVPLPLAATFDAKGNPVKRDVFTISEIPRVVDRHPVRLDLHEPADLAHRTCKRKYAMKPTSLEAVQKIFDRQVARAKRAEIARLKTERLAEESRKREAEAASEETSDAPPELALLPQEAVTAAVAATDRFLNGDGEEIEFQIPVPTKRPENRVLVATSERSEDESRERSVPKENGPSLGELERKYLSDKVEAKPDQLVELGGAFGPNPHGIPVLNGGRELTQAPVPVRAPEIICGERNRPTEELPEIEERVWPDRTISCLPVPTPRTAGLSTASGQPRTVEGDASEPEQGDGDNG